MDKIVSLCKRRGFIFPGSEIYGGLANTWDYGPYGVELKNNVKKAWWRTMVHTRDDVVGLDAAILMNPKTWQASGHLECFADPLLDCKNCNERVRGDKLIEEAEGMEVFEYRSKYSGDMPDNAKEDLLAFITHVFNEHKDIYKCPSCGKSDWTEARSFNLMFKTQQGTVEGEGKDIYLRPETAQGIFVNFKNVVDSARKKIPFGIAQIGKSFRNEITPGHFTFRTREFEQMELEYFIAPEDGDRAFNELADLSWNWYLDHGIKKENLRFRDHDEDELSHYSKMTKDIEYKFPFGWGELAGVAHRSDYDLKQHIEHSGEKLEYFDQVENKRYIPHVIEPSFGVDRTVLTFLIDAYHDEELEDGSTRTVLKFHPRIAPIKAAILPLMKKPELTAKAREIFKTLSELFVVEYDETGSIGKRYRRQDEIGTPLCITIDFDTLEKGVVTVRDRDSMEQTSVNVDEITGFVAKALA